MSAERDPLALAPVTVRRCDIERLKRKIAKLRHDRDEWRKRVEAAETIISVGNSAWYLEQRNRYVKEIEALKMVIADRVIEKLKVKP